MYICQCRITAITVYQVLTRNSRSNFRSWFKQEIPAYSGNPLVQLLSVYTVPQGGVVYTDNTNVRGQDIASLSYPVEAGLNRDAWSENIIRSLLGLIEIGESYSNHRFAG